MELSCPLEVLGVSTMWLHIFIMGPCYSSSGGVEGRPPPSLLLVSSFSFLKTQTFYAFFCFISAISFYRAKCKITSILPVRGLIGVTFKLEVKMFLAKIKWKFDPMKHASRGVAWRVNV